MVNLIEWNRIIIACASVLKWIECISELVFFPFCLLRFNVVCWDFSIYAFRVNGIGLKQTKISANPFIANNPTKCCAIFGCFDWNENRTAIDEEKNGLLVTIAEMGWQEEIRAHDYAELKINVKWNQNDIFAYTQALKRYVGNVRSVLLIQCTVSCNIPKKKKPKWKKKKIRLGSLRLLCVIRSKIILASI